MRAKRILHIWNVLSGEMPWNIKNMNNSQNFDHFFSNWNAWNDFMFSSNGKMNSVLINIWTGGQTNAVELNWMINCCLDADPTCWLAINLIDYGTTIVGQPFTSTVIRDGTECLGVCGVFSPCLNKFSGRDQRFSTGGLGPKSGSPSCFDWFTNVFVRHDGKRACGLIFVEWVWHLNL